MKTYNWLRWVEGRQNKGYYKLCLYSFLFFDAYIIKMINSEINPHKDPVPNRNHYRYNHKETNMWW